MHCLDMNTAPSSVLSPCDQLELNRISRELEDPHVSTERLREMLAEVTEIAKRYECDLSMGSD